MYILTLDGVTCMTTYVPVLVFQIYTSLLYTGGIRSLNVRVDVLFINYNVRFGNCYRGSPLFSFLTTRALAFVSRVTCFYELFVWFI